MSKTTWPQRFASQLLESAAMVFRDDFERGDPLAPFNFAALYVRFNGRPADIPDWVADRFLYIAGEWAAGFQTGASPARSLDEIAGLRRKKLWRKRQNDAAARLFLSLFERLTQRAREATASAGSPYATRPGRDGQPVPIPKNEYSDGQHRCSIIDARNRATSKFQVMLARQCGVTGNSDRAVYEAVQRIRRKHIHK